MVRLIVLSIAGQVNEIMIVPVPHATEPDHMLPDLVSVTGPQPFESVAVTTLATSLQEVGAAVVVVVVVVVEVVVVVVVVVVVLHGVAVQLHIPALHAPPGGLPST